VGDAGCLGMAPFGAKMRGSMTRQCGDEWLCHALGASKPFDHRPHCSKGRIGIACPCW